MVVERKAKLLGAARNFRRSTVQGKLARRSFIRARESTCVLFVCAGTVCAGSHAQFYTHTRSYGS